MFLEINSMPRFDSLSKVIGLIHITRDIMESKRLEEKLINAYNQLEAKVKERTVKLKAENNERKIIEENLRFTKKELISYLKELKESNIALKVLLKQRQNDQNDFENNILSNINHLVLPYLAKITEKQYEQQ